MGPHTLALISEQHCVSDFSAASGPPLVLVLDTLLEGGVLMVWKYILQ